MNSKRVLRNLDKELGSRVEVRRYNLPNMISESYKTLYSCESGTNMQRLVESHLEDVRENPSEIERLSRQLAIIKEVQKLTESGEISDKDLTAVTQSQYEGDVEKKVAEEREERVAPTEEVKSEDIKESKEEDLLEDTELTEEEVEALTQHLAEIRKNKKVTESEKACYQPTKEEAAAVVSRIQRKYGSKVTEKEYMDTLDIVIGEDDIDTDIVDHALTAAGIEIIEDMISEADTMSNYADNSMTPAMANSLKDLTYDVVAVDWNKRGFKTVASGVSREEANKVQKRTAASFIVEHDPRRSDENCNEARDFEFDQDLWAVVKDDGTYAGVPCTSEEEAWQLAINHGGSAIFKLVSLDKARESKTYESLDLSEFRKKSVGKAFVKTFKKLDKQLHEGTALTRQDAISLYKAANSAMTHLSVELEHNPEFMSTFKESAALLSADVASLLESMKKGKAPNASTMKSLAKFSEAMLREEDEEEELPPIEDEEDDLTDENMPEEQVSEEEEFDRDYADARIELHQELVDEYAEEESPAIVDKLTQDAEEILDLPGITKEQTAEIEAELEETPAEDTDELPESAYNGGQAENGFRDTYKRPGGNTSGSGSNHKALAGKKTKQVLAKDMKPGMVTNTGKVLRVTDRGNSIEVSYGGIGRGGSHAADNVPKNYMYDVLDEDLDKSEEESVDKRSGASLDVEDRGDNTPDLDLGDESDITDDELAELKKHLREMRSSRKVTESKGRPLKRRA